MGAASHPARTVWRSALVVASIHDAATMSTAVDGLKERRLLRDR